MNQSDVDWSDVDWISKYQNAGCSMFQMEAPEAADYPGRRDMLVGYTVIPELWRRAHSEERTHTDDLSQAGETFCYVKIDGIAGLGGSDFADREDIEDALDEALAAAGIGCVIGAGTGRRYSYVDLALADVTKGCEIVRRVLRQGNITRRSWILGFEQSFPWQWIGIWKDSPPPPR